MSILRLIAPLFVSLFWTACGQPNQVTSLDGTVINLKQENSQGLVVLFIAPDCPLSQAYILPYKQLDSMYGGEFIFISVIPGNYYTRKEIDHFIDSFHFNLPIVVDSMFHLTKKWKATTTPQCIITNREGLILYSGSIDNWAIALASKRLSPTRFYARDALNDIISGKKPAIQSTKPVGCIIEIET